MPRNRLPRVLKHYSPTGRRNHGIPLKRLLDTWDRNGSTSSPTPWKIYDDNDYVLIIALWKAKFIYRELLENIWFLQPTKYTACLLKTSDS